MSRPVAHRDNGFPFFCNGCIPTTRMPQNKKHLAPFFQSLNENTDLYVAVWNTPLSCLLVLQKNNWETLMGQRHVAITETATVIWVTKAEPWSC